MLGKVFYDSDFIKIAVDPKQQNIVSARVESPDCSYLQTRKAMPGPKGTNLQSHRSIHYLRISLPKVEI